jgi:hypothetical protein
VGGAIVSDPLDSSFQNQVLFTDLARGSMFSADYDQVLVAEALGAQATLRTLKVSFNNVTGTFANVIGAARGDARFGADEFGNVYIVSKQTGRIFRTGLLTQVAVPEPASLLLILVVVGILGVSRCRWSGAQSDP